MITVFTIIFIFAAVLLIAVILVQQPKTSGGLFAGTGQSLLGTSGKTFWTKATISLAIFFMILSIILSILPRYETPASVTDIIQKQQQAAQAPPVSSSAAPAPGANNIPAPQSVPAEAQQAMPAAAQPAVPAPSK